MDELEVSFDTFTTTWSLASERVASVGGVATARLDDTLRVHVDAISGIVLEVEVVAAPDGSLSEPTRRIVAQVLERDLRAGTRNRVRAEVEAAVVELALLERAADEAEALGDPSPWWFVELDVRRRRLGLTAIEPDLLGRRARGRALSLLTVADDPALDAEVGLLAEEAGIETDRSLTVSLEAARRRLAELDTNTGRLPPGDGVCHLDPGFIERGVLDLRDGCEVVGDGRFAITLRTKTAEVYAAQVSTISAVAIDQHDVVVSINALDIGPGGDGRGAGVVNLVLHPDRPRSSLRVMLTSEPIAIPSVRLLDRRSRARTALLAARSARLGAAELAEQLWRTSTDGSDWSAAPFEPWRCRPFAGELAS